MKVLLLSWLLVVLVVLEPTQGDRLKRPLVESWVDSVNELINEDLASLPNGQQLEMAADALGTVAGTVPLSLDDLFAAIDNLVAAAINLADGFEDSTVVSLLGAQLAAISNLVDDAQNDNQAALTDDINAVICVAQALGGLDECNLAPMSSYVDKLLNAVTERASAATIIADAFSITTAAISVGARGPPTPAVNGILTLMTDICSLVLDAISQNSLLIAKAVPKVVQDATEIGYMLL